MKKFINLLVAVLISSLFLSPSAFAHNDAGKDSLVALGDSISFGYNLEKNNKNPAKAAFPYLIGKEVDLRVRNLGKTGWQTDQLLAALQHDQKYRQAVKHADYVTVTIGSNDLIEILLAAHAESGGNTALFEAIVTKKLAGSDLLINLKAIVGEIRSLTDAPIVLYNIYNPFQTTHPAHDIANKVLPHVNGSILQIANCFSDVIIADAHGAFGNQQAIYVIPGDVHPTIAGHKKLASIGVDAIIKAGALTYAR